MRVLCARGVIKSVLLTVMSGITEEISVWHGRLITFEVNK